MKSLGKLLLMGSFATLCGAQQVAPPVSFVNTLMPEPASLTVDSGLFPVTAHFSATTGSFDDARLDGAIERALHQLKQQTGVEIPAAIGRGAEGQLVVDVDGPGQAVQSVDENESYTLAVTASGIHLHAATDVGAMHGLETLMQLVQPDRTGYVIPAVSIHDTPRFRWRGLMIDCSRHFEPVDVLERMLDGMAAVKMNVFHRHLSDDQGFRMESKVFPAVTQLGSDGQYYTQDQAREIVQYARARGIRVVPEFDMPGHSSALLTAYPDLASAPGPFHIETHFGIFDPTLDPTRESTYQFLNKFVGEMASIFPDAYMHIGGDENNGNEWRQNPRIQQFMRAHNLKDTAALQAYFNQRLFAILQAHGKKMIGWDEVLTPGLPKNVVVQSWRGFSSLAAGAREGYDGILSAGYYLDHMDSAADHYAVDPLPADSDLTPQQQARILGGEACMWAEYVDARIIDSRVWPITAAIAERLWSPRDVRNVNDMYRRLWVESVRIESLGLTQISQEGASLRQLSGSIDIGPMRVFAAAIEPVVFDDRDAYTEKHDVTQLTPLDHLVDAVPPDPPSRQALELLVDAYLASPAQHQKERGLLLATFQAWVTAEPAVLQTMAQSPLLQPAQQRMTQLSQLGTMGVQAIGYLSAGKPCPADWKAAQLATLKTAAEPVALVRFSVLDPIRKLVDAVPAGDAQKQ
jgi:hexosaminidase